MASSSRSSVSKETSPHLISVQREKLNIQYAEVEGSFNQAWRLVRGALHLTEEVRVQSGRYITSSQTNGRIHLETALLSVMTWYRSKTLRSIFPRFLSDCSRTSRITQEWWDGRDGATAARPSLPSQPIRKNIWVRDRIKRNGFGLIKGDDRWE